MKLKSWHGVVLIVCFAATVFLLYRGYEQEQGRKAFLRLGCPTCHIAGGAPSLEHVGRKYNRAQFVEWITDPEMVYKRVGHKPLNPGYEEMPKMAASHEEIDAISYYLSASR